MNRKFLFILMAVAAYRNSAAQTNGSSGIWKAGVGYTYNYPGMTGYSFAGEYIIPLTEQFEGSIGAKYIDLNGHPRTPSVGEYVRAKTLDFNAYWLPLRSDAQLFRIGLGYSFSFYNTKAAYPLTIQTDGKQTTQWPTLQEKGTTTGINLIAEYEYIIPNSCVSIGLRAALYKASDRTYFIGPLVGYRW
ncbi:MAG: hypothetical protein Q8943_00805 [Bacteroidota bacterium]|nr:hypothetical protein [Bacteroidota bacterium]